MARTAALFGLALLGVLATACSRATDDEVKRMLGGVGTYGLVAEPASVTRCLAYRIDGDLTGYDEGREAAEFVHGYGVLSGPVDVTGELLREVSSVLAASSTYVTREEPWKSTFEPLVALRFEGTDTNVDLLVCFNSTEVMAYRDGVEPSRGLTYFEPGRADVVRIAKRLFPDDTRLQGFGE